MSATDGNGGEQSGARAELARQVQLVSQAEPADVETRLCDAAGLLASFIQACELSEPDVIAALANAAATRSGSNAEKAADIVSAELRAVVEFKAAQVSYLRKRAVSSRIALAAGFRSVDGETAAKLLGRASALSSGGIAIPYVGSIPPYVRVRFDEGVGGDRFLAPAEREVPIYVPSTRALTIDEGIVVTEGPVKAVALIQAGWFAIGLGGVSTTLTPAPERALNESWQALSIRGRDVVVLNDSNRASNPAVAQAEARLTIAIERGGARSVRVAALARSDDGKDWGPDDCLAAKGANYLKSIIDAATPANPVVFLDELVARKGEAGIEARAEALLDDLPFLLAARERGSTACSQLRKRFREFGIRMKDFDDAVKRATRRLTEHSGKRSNGAALERERFEIVAGSLCRIVVRYDNEGNRDEQRLAICNFTPRMEHEILRDDGGGDPIRQFEIVSTLETGQELPRAIVSVEQFDTGSWVLEQLGAQAIIEPRRSAVAELRAGIQRLSTPTQEYVFTHLGFREIGGTLAYLSAGGAVGASDVTVDIGEALRRYRLPDAISDLPRAVRRSLRLLKIAAPEVAFPLFCAAYRAPLQHFLYADVMVWLVGRSGALKSTAAAIVSSHFGEFTYSSLPGSWHDTYANLEHKLFLAKDVVFVIDDAAPEGDARLNDQVRRTQAYVVRAIGNGAWRGRMTADLRERPSRRPRALALSTAEDTPDGESLGARLFVLPVTSTTFKRSVVTELQEHSADLAESMLGYVEWLRLHADDLAARVSVRFTAIRDRLVRDGRHLREPSAIGHLLVGAELFAEFAVACGVFSSAGQTKFVQHAERALCTASMGREAERDDANPVNRFWRVLQTQLAQGRVFINAIEDALASRSDSKGIGWHTGDELYLLPDAAYEVVSTAGRTADRPFPLRPTQLWRQLHEAGHLLRRDVDHFATKESVPAGLDGEVVRERVLVLPKRMLGETHPQSPTTSNAGRTGSEPGQIEGATGAEFEGEGLSLAANPGEITSQVTTPKATRPNRPETAGTTPLAADGACGSWEDAPRADARGAGVVDGDRGTGAAISVEVEIITDRSRLGAVAKAINGAVRVGLDFETLGLDPLIDPPRLLQAAVEGSPVFVIDLAAVDGLGPVADALGDATVVCHNALFDLTILKHRFGVAPKVVADTMMLAILTDGALHLERRGRRKKRSKAKGKNRVDEPGYYALAEVARRTLGIALPKDEQTSDWSGPLTDEQIAYAARDAAVLLPLVENLKKQAVEMHLGRVVRLESELIPVVIDMMLTGVGVDVDAVDSVVATNRDRAESLAGTLKTQLGVTNPRSPPQILRALLAKGIRTKATSAEALAKYAAQSEEVRFLFEFRRVDAFVRGLGQHLVDGARRYPDGRLHAKLRPLAAPTGRFGASDPNLLAVPKDPQIRTCFVAPAGFKLVSADYAAIELRVLADLTGDETLVETFRAGRSPHRETASLILGKPYADTTKPEANNAKPVNFGFSFGQGAEKFVSYAMKSFGVAFELHEARKFRTAFLAHYTGVAAWQRKTAQQRVRDVRTASGRLRRLPDVKHSYTKRLNTPVQGTAADGIKRAMVLLHQRLPAFGARLILCVHDELVVEAPDESVADVERVVRETMVEAMSEFVTKVPIVVESRIGQTWGDP